MDLALLAISAGLTTFLSSRFLAAAEGENRAATSAATTAAIKSAADGACGGGGGGSAATGTATTWSHHHPNLPPWRHRRSRCVFAVTIQAVLFLSFCLFSLSVLEATPPRWSVVLSRSSGGGTSGDGSYNLLVNNNNEEGSSGDDDHGNDDLSGAATGRTGEGDETSAAAAASAVVGRSGLVTIESAYCAVLIALSALILAIYPFLVGWQVLGRMLEGGSYLHLPQAPWLLRLAWSAVSAAFRCAHYVTRIVVGRMLCFCRKIIRRGQPQHHQAGYGPILATFSHQQQPTPPQQDGGDGVTSSATAAATFRTGILGGICSVAASLACLRLLAPFVIRTEQDAPLLTLAVSWLSSVGLLCSAVLNGFGSVSLPHSCLAGLYLEPIRSETIDQAEAELEKVKKSLEDRKSQLSEPGVRIQLMPVSGSWKRTSFTELGDEVSQRRQVLLGEIEFLETLVDEMEEDISEMRESQKMALQARTLTGRVKSWVGVVFSVVLLLRLFSAVMSAWPQMSAEIETANALSSTGRGGGDIVTRILMWLFGHKIVKTRENVNALSQFISLIITAFLAFSQVRNFMRIAAAVNRRLKALYSKCYCIKGKKDSSLSASISQDGGLQLLNGFCSPLLASLMGCYFIACVVLTKIMLPAKFSSSFAAALGGPSMFQIRLYSVNATFALSALISTAVLGMTVGIQRQNTFRHQSWSVSSTGGTSGDASRHSVELDP